MERQTVDYGIDLGTTNSAIARIERSGPKVIKNRLQHDTTPSVVARTRTGQTVVGSDAVNKVDLNPARQFKRLMGTAHGATMKDGASLLPEELSAEILKELRAAVQLRYDESPEYVVITVPAMFQQPQCEATHRAAELAGMQAVSLLQEPIAAATAYISGCPEEGYYVVYDLGGGTFDVSIISVRNGEMNVVTHGGDNYLGSSDFDREIYNWVLNQFQSNFGTVPGLPNEADKYRLLQVCESGKIELSFRDTAVLDLGDLEVPAASLTLDRRTLEDLVGQHISRTIALTRERVADAGLRMEDIGSVLLVGGPTMMPFVRSRLKDELGVPVLHDQDPMTVVAEGAAIHAGTLLKPQARSVATSTGAASAELELHYEPVSPDVQCSISGKVIRPAGFTGEIMISRSGKDWGSGWIPLRNGAFVCPLLLRSDAISDFTFSLRDERGVLVPTSPASVSIRHGVATAKPVTPYDYGIALEDGSFDPVLRHGTPLPAYESIHYHASKTVAAGSSDQFPVFFLEGSSSVARDNVKVGQIYIRGRDLKRTLKEGEPIEVRLQMDEARLIKAAVYIPLHDIEYPVAISSLIDDPPVEDLGKSMAELQSMLSDVIGVADDSDADTLLGSQRELEQIEADFEQAATGEIGAAEKVAKRLSDTKGRVREIKSKYAASIKYREACEEIERAESMAQRYDNRIDMAALSELRSEAERFLRLKDVKGLDGVCDKASSIFWRHYVNTEECWTGLVDYLKGQRPAASDDIAFDEYLSRADGCLQRRDFEGVRFNGVKALDLLPDGRSVENRFWGTIMRR